MQRQYGVAATEAVTFTQISAAEHSYRDAVRFCNGRELRLQELCEGLRMTVLDLSKPELRVPVVRVVIPGLEGYDRAPGYTLGARGRARLEGRR